MARLHWRFLLRFQARFNYWQVVQIAAESPVVYTKIAAKKYARLAFCIFLVVFSLSFVFFFF